ncbi:MAG TPA: NAD(P)H-dependent glycerol-3-phosphate dehydrogenase [Candidatus Limnocylindrales bacterium]|nr:NAD(P)H-dependent glycerol-3-phosphate dehydrogenase [Candidatus Limnocylindrales bacterium]
MKKIAIIGAGGWGTALAIVLGGSRAPHRIALWAREQDVLESLRAERKNPAFLPGYTVPASVEVTGDLGQAANEADIIIGAMPSAHARKMYADMLPFLDRMMGFVSATKGLEPETLLRMTEIIEQVLTPKFWPRVAAISGPSFALEVARGDPTAIVAASKDRMLATEIQDAFSGPTLRVYTNDDVVGVELGGAVKNVIAIAAGVAEGLGLGHNTIAALITRGLAEMTRLGTAFGARKETLAGLAGMGDLVLTCTGELSRNRSLGAELGRGRKLDDILASTRMVAEGVGTTAAARALALRLGIEMPITEQMYAVLYEGRSPQDAIRELMDRPLKAE